MSKTEQPKILSAEKVAAIKNSGRPITVLRRCTNKDCGYTLKHSKGHTVRCPACGTIHK